MLSRKPLCPGLRKCNVDKTSIMQGRTAASYIMQDFYKKIAIWGQRKCRVFLRNECCTHEHKHHHFELENNVLTICIHDCHGNYTWLCQAINYTHEIILPCNFYLESLKKTWSNWLNLWKCCTPNLTMHLSHIPRRIIQDRNVPISVLNCVLWEIRQVHCGIFSMKLCTSYDYVKRRIWSIPFNWMLWWKYDHETITFYIPKYA